MLNLLTYFCCFVCKLGVSIVVEQKCPAVSPSFISAAGRLNIFLRSMRRASKPVLLKDWAKRYSVQHKMFLNRSCHFLHIQIRKSCCPIHAACDVFAIQSTVPFKTASLKAIISFLWRSGGFTAVILQQVFVAKEKDDEVLQNR